MKLKPKSIAVFALAVVGALLLAFFAMTVYHVFQRNQAALDELRPSTNELTAEDSSFLKNSIRRLRVKEIHNSSSREPISEMTLDSEYNIILYKTKTSAITPLA